MSEPKTFTDLKQVLEFLEGEAQAAQDQLALYRHHVKELLVQVIQEMVKQSKPRKKKA